MVNRRPSFGRSRAVRGLDLFDTPPIALGPLFAHEPLLAGVTTVAEPFCGKGNLVIAMRARGLTVIASDICDRGCPDSTVLDFRAMTARPPGCDVLLSNLPLWRRHGATSSMRWRSDSAWSCFCSRCHFCAPPSGTSACTSAAICAACMSWPSGCRTCTTPTIPARRASQSQVHAWFVFDRDYCGPATINPVSIHRPAARMPWAGDNGNGYHGPRGTSRGYVLARLARDGRADLAARVEAGALSVRAALSALKDAEGAR